MRLHALLHPPRRWAALALASILAATVALVAPPPATVYASSATAALALAPAATGTLDPAVSGQGVAAIKTFETRINALRAKNGRKPLKFNLYATQDAYNWSKTMARTDQFRHTSSASERPSMSRFAGSWAVWGENIAARSNTDINGIFDQWAASPGHRSNMLSAEYDTYGVGFYTRRSGDKGSWAMYASTVFYRTKPGKSLVGTYASVSNYATPAVAGGAVKVSGTARVGTRLTAKVTPFRTTSVKLAYRWYRNGAAISGATRSTYVPVAADRGKRLSVKVTASRSGYASRTVSSASTAAVGSGLLGAKPVRGTGTLQQGKRVTASTSAWTPGGVKLSYRWYRNGAAISGATARSYVLKRADRGRSIKVRVSGSKSGFSSKAVTSKATAKVR